MPSITVIDRITGKTVNLEYMYDIGYTPSVVAKRKNKCWLGCILALICAIIVLLVLCLIK